MASPKAKLDAFRVQTLHEKYSTPSSSKGTANGYSPSTSSPHVLSNVIRHISAATKFREAAEQTGKNRTTKRISFEGEPSPERRRTQFKPIIWTGFETESERAEITNRAKLKAAAAAAPAQYNLPKPTCAPQQDQRKPSVDESLQALSIASPKPTPEEKSLHAFGITIPSGDDGDGAKSVGETSSLPPSSPAASAAQQRHLSIAPSQSVGQALAEAESALQRLRTVLEQKRAASAVWPSTFLSSPSGPAVERMAEHWAEVACLLGVPGRGIGLDAAAPATPLHERAMPSPSEGSDHRWARLTLLVLQRSEQQRMTTVLWVAPPQRVAKAAVSVAIEAATQGLNGPRVAQAVIDRAQLAMLSEVDRAYAKSMELWEKGQNALPGGNIGASKLLAEHPDLRRWLVKSAGIDEKYVDKALDVLDQQMVATVDDLHTFSRLPEFDSLLMPVMGAKIREALEHTFEASSARRAKSRKKSRRTPRSTGDEGGGGLTAPAAPAGPVGANGFPLSTNWERVNAMTPSPEKRPHSAA